MTETASNTKPTNLFVDDRTLFPELIDGKSEVHVTIAVGPEGSLHDERPVGWGDFFVEAANEYFAEQREKRKLKNRLRAAWTSAGGFKGILQKGKGYVGSASQFLVRIGRDGYGIICGAVGRFRTTNGVGDGEISPGAKP